MSKLPLIPPVRPMNAISQGRRSSFAALRHRDFRLLWIGQIVSTTGTQMQLVAINWHVYLLTRSPLALGAVGLVRVVPIILCSLLGGVVADAVDRKRLMIITQSIMLVSAALLALSTALGIETVWPLYLLTAVASAAGAFDNPARQALLPSLVPTEELSNAVSLGLIVFQVAMIVGPAVAGFILVGSGPALIYGLNAVSFLAVIIALLLMRASCEARNVETTASQVNLESLREGWRFVWRTPIIVQTMTLDFIGTFFASATALLPIYAAEILGVGARGLGFLAAAPAAGAIFSGLIMARLGTFRRQGATVVVAIISYGTATIAFGVSRVYWFSLLMLALTGAADTVSTILRQTIRQLVTPNHLRGRMTSINMVFFMGGPQLGEMEAGVVAAMLGATLSVVTGGIGCVLAGLFSVMFASNLIRYNGYEPEETIRSTRPQIP